MPNRRQAEDRRREIVDDPVQDACDPGNAGIVCNQVLPYLDPRVRQAGGFRMVVHREVLRGTAGVRLIIADDKA